MITEIFRTIKRIFRIAKSIFALCIYFFPQRGIKLIGVTGTSGKSTTASLIYTVLNENGYKAGVITTVEARIGEKTIDTGLHVTTPDPIELIKLISTMQREGAKFIVIESSSHSLEQGRLGILKFDFAVFTNITKDHLDYHKTWEQYATSKLRLLKKLKKDGVAIINKDDSGLHKLFAKVRKKKVEFSKTEEITNITTSVTHTEFLYKNVKFSLGLLGEYNIDNAMAAIKIAESLNISTENIGRALGKFKGVKGRMESAYSKDFTIIIDFAHNTDSLKNAIESIRKTMNGGRIITVFGSAGLRDKEKRFTMGMVSGKLADITIVTAEDPRTEDLKAINTAIINGAEESNAKLVKRFANREEYRNFVLSKELENIKMSKEKLVFAFDEKGVEGRLDAIEFAIKIAQPNDVVLTEGKGHEQSLCIDTVEYPYSDHEAVKKALKNLEII